MKKLIGIYLIITSVLLFSCEKEQSPQAFPLKTQFNLTVDGLVAHYSFDGNANDQSGNNLNAVVNGAILTNDRFGRENSAYSFDKNQDIIVPYTEELNLYPISISLWYYVSEINDNERCNIFSKYSSAAWNGYQIKIGDYRNVGNNDGNGDVYFNTGFGTNAWYIRDSKNRVLGFYSEAPFLQSGVATNVWYHYVFIIDDTGGKIFVNGKLITAHSWTGTPGSCNNSYMWKIGGKYDHWFRGKIDDIRIYNRPLSQEEISFLFDQN